jgi:small Trp-rich protein
MLYTALLFVSISAVLAGLKYMAIAPVATWEWWQVGAPGAAFAGLFALIWVGSLIHAAINRAGWRDGGGTD